MRASLWRPSRAQCCRSQAAAAASAAPIGGTHRPARSPLCPERRARNMGGWGGAKARPQRARALCKDRKAQRQLRKPRPLAGREEPRDVGRVLPNSSRISPDMRPNSGCCHPPSPHRSPPPGTLAHRPRRYPSCAGQRSLPTRRRSPPRPIPGGGRAMHCRERCGGRQCWTPGGRYWAHGPLEISTRSPCCARSMGADTRKVLLSESTVELSPHRFRAEFPITRAHAWARASALRGAAGRDSDLQRRNWRPESQ